MTFTPLCTALALLVAVTSGCTRSDSSVESARPETARSAQPLFTNGNFEDGTLNGWSTSTNLNPGITFPPTSTADLNLQPGGENLTSAKQAVGGPESEIPAGLTSAEPLRWPRYGQWAAVVNELGRNRNVNLLVQSATLTSADVDPADGKVHVQFAFAPVLQNPPSHGASDQPYIYITLRNVTRDTVLWSMLNFANQPGVSWKTTSTNIQYTDWRAVDVAPGDAQLSVGDTVVLEVIAAGCSQGSHWGHVYVDGFGSFLPGLSIAASAPKSANKGSDLTYTYRVKNSGEGPVDNTTVTIVLPDQTSFVSIDTPPGVTCTHNSATRTVTCDLGTMNPTATTTFGVEVHIDPAATGQVSHGNYSVEGQGVSPLIGPLVQTPIGPLHTLTVQKDPAGEGSGTLISSPAAINCGPRCASASADFAEGTLVSLTATAQFGSTFKGWSGGCTGTTNPCTFTLDKAASVSALFEVSPYPITTHEVPGGTLSCPSSVTPGQSATCTITVTRGYLLISLTDNGVDVTASVSENGTYVLTNVTRGHELAASFSIQPNTTLISPLPSRWSQDTTAAFGFISSWGISFECSLDGAPFAACSSPKSYSDLSDREHTFQVRALSSEGDVDPAPATYSWTVDTAPPQRPLIQAPTSQQPLYTSRPVFSGTAEASSAVKVFVDGVELGTVEANTDGAWALTTPPLSWGSHSATAATTDLAGNLSEPSFQVSFTTAQRSYYSTSCAAGSTAWVPWACALLIPGLLRCKRRRYSGTCIPRD